MSRRPSGSPAPELPDALLARGAWPGAEAEVTLVETHISWVFLVGCRAYKVKKPVKLDFLDFSTLALRHHFCEEELRINRRFAPGLYLGLSRVVRSDAGLAVDRDGEVVDWAVRMQRFDRSQELDALLARDAVAREALEDFGTRLAGQHQAAPVAAAGSRWASPARNLRACRENFETLRRLAPESLGPRIDAFEQWTLERYTALEPRFARRVADGRFRECHGDLHCANVVRHDDELWAFDALEFDPGLRWIDVANDVAFLYMDLRARGRDDLASALLDGWLAASGDFDALGVFRFYEAYRAGVRAKVAAIRAAQADGRDADEGLHRQVATYLGDAERVMQAPAPVLVVTTGLSGSGKSWLASRLLAPLGAIRLRSDVERKRLAGLAAGASSGGGIYSAGMTHRTYERLAQLARAALGDGFSVIVDAACLLASERQAFRALARDLGVRHRLLWVEAGQATLESRLAARASAGRDPSEADAQVLALQQEIAEPPTAAEQVETVRVDTGDGPPDLEALARALRGPRQPAP